MRSESSGLIHVERESADERDRLAGVEDREMRMAALYALADSRDDTPIDLIEDLALRERMTMSGKRLCNFLRGQ